MFNALALGRFDRATAVHLSQLPLLLNHPPPPSRYLKTISMSASMSVVVANPGALQTAAL